MSYALLVKGTPEALDAVEAAPEVLASMTGCAELTLERLEPGQLRIGAPATERGRFAIELLWDLIGDHFDGLTHYRPEQRAFR